MSDILNVLPRTLVAPFLSAQSRSSPLTRAVHTHGVESSLPFDLYDPITGVPDVAAFAPGIKIVRGEVFLRLAATQTQNLGATAEAPRLYEATP